MKKTTMEAIADFPLKLLHYGFTLIICIILISTILFNKSDMSFSGTFMVCAAVFGLLFFSVSLYALEKWLTTQGRMLAWMKKREALVVGFFFGILFLVQMIIILQSMTRINWDAGVLFDTATSKDFRPVFEAYFSYFPNNTFLLFFFRGLYESCISLFSIELENFRRVLCMINILAVDFGFYFGYLIMKKIFSRKIAFRYLLMLTLLFGFSPWLMVPYSDTLAIPFTTGSLYLLLLIKDSKKTISKVMLSIVTGVVFMAGYSIKPSVIIVFIAALIIYGLKYIFNIRKLIFLLLTSSIILVTLFGSLKLWDYYIYSYQTALPMNEEVRFPWTYWLATGISKPYGVCNEADQWATIYRGTSDRMMELHKEMVKERLIDMGVGGYLTFVFEKLQWITSEGFFFWGEEGNLIMSADWNLKQSNLWKELFYYNGNLRPYFYFYYQSIWVFILFFVILGGCSNAKKQKEEMLVSRALIQCILIGILSFILLFEGRSRYLILYVPYFAMLSSLGFENIYQFINIDLHKTRRIK